MKSAIRIALFVVLLFSAGYAYCDGGSYVVKLKNGNVLTANSYRIEKGHVYLKYPLGEAAIRESQVESIETQDGRTEYFQSKGELVKSEPRAPEIGARPAPQPAMPEPPVAENQPPASDKTPAPQAQETPQSPEDRKFAPATVSPHAAEIDKFIDDYFSADDNKKATIDQN